VKKITWILMAVALLAVVVAPTMALANNGPHGDYVADTDMCAECHRAHTAPSSITWTDNQGAQKNALLLTDADQGYLFCLACHDDASQGADTNVTGGTYQGTAYGTLNADMISGAFGSVNANLPTGSMYDQHGTAVTSAHLMNGGSWGAYGGGLYGVSDPLAANGNDVTLYGTGNKIVMSCVTCHDPHGSSNYRILKDVVNGVTVGGYVGGGQNPTPAPYVISNEIGSPQTGFALHTAYPNYKPNYTVANYAIPTATSKGMTGWCVGCHTTYAYADQAPVTVGDVTTVPNGSVYNSGDAFGLVARHRHPMNVALSSYLGAQALISDASLGLPVDHPTSQQRTTGSPVYTSGDYTSADWIECLTCHNAHGSTATMAGWSDLTSATVVATAGSRGVLPVDSNLLKKNNSGVCESCHNK